MKERSTAGKPHLRTKGFSARFLDGNTPIPTESPPDLDGPTKLVATPVPGGLHHRYERRAA